MKLVEFMSAIIIFALLVLYVKFIYRLLKTFFSGHTFYFDTNSNKRDTNRCIEDYIDIIKVNLTKTVDVFDLAIDRSALHQTVQAYLSQLRQKLIQNVSTSPNMFLTVNAMEHIKECLKLLEQQINALCSEKRLMFRFKYDDNYFTVFLVTTYKSLNYKHNIYGISICGDNDTYYLLSYDEEIKKCLNDSLGIVSDSFNSEIVESDIIDGLNKKYIKLIF